MVTITNMTVPLFLICFYQDIHSQFFIIFILWHSTILLRGLLYHKYIKKQLKKSKMLSALRNFLNTLIHIF